MLRYKIYFSYFKKLFQFRNLSIEILYSDECSFVFMLNKTKNTTNPSFIFRLGIFGFELKIQLVTNIEWDYQNNCYRNINNIDKKVDMT